MQWIENAINECRNEVNRAKDRCKESDQEYERIKEIASVNDRRLEELESLLTWLEQVARNSPLPEVPL